MKISTGLTATLTAAVLLVGAPVGVMSAMAADDATAAAQAANKRAQRAIATRQGALKLLGFYMGPLGGMARGKIPMDVAVVERNAGHIAALAPIVGDTFALDTSNTDLATEALPVIWTKPNEFAAKGQALWEKATALVEIAKTNADGKNERAIKGGIGALGQACGSCHEDFRVDDE